MSFPTHAGEFALGTFAHVGGRPFPGLVVDGRVRDVSALGRTVRDLLVDWDSTLTSLRRLAADPRGDWRGGDTLLVLPPLEPGQILQSGANYRQHVIDLVAAEREAANGATPEEARADAAAMMDARAESGTPYLFLGSPRAMCGAFDDVVLPREGEQHDWELELALVIGRPGRRIPRSEAMSHVAAYTMSNDITTRDRLYRPDLKAIGTDWFVAKNAMTFLPTGPFLVPAEFVGDPMRLRIRLEHNGVVRQDESTKDMIFDVARLIEYASTITELRPGDLLLTGSPAGNGAHWDVFLKPGDVLECSITGLGAQRNTCVAED
ncbi:fumarylacetoacetate hydrolase family protein [Cryptosporangium arvum]|uniref:2-keto-4-pentenoate hydratase/2-oxohepta-3-ene-1,7-dioic acid hydratase n=1 Tax=Cryptosporangium arvum DSM 44712 TaxID=927661 RepID=A0A011ACK7_9ACTN|nr:fumarylacetoacetate hydrolase family protein [Cryptosporangium arvum]EXG79746.1 2-keto-4-pentenoate hydratase/2-oxohepta-3-ene-1,7-dioic acid hydratase [Cryptosporangium arvum DSM 44712]